MQIELDDRDCQNLINILMNTQHPWTITNPLIQKIAQQMQRQQLPRDPPQMPMPKGNNEDRTHPSDVN